MINLSRILQVCCTYENSSVRVKSSNGELIQLSFNDLALKVWDLVFYMRAAGINNKSVIALHAKNSLEWILLDLAANEIGCLLLAVPEDFDVNESVLKLIKPDLFIVDSLEQWKNADINSLFFPLKEFVNRQFIGLTINSEDKYRDKDLYTQVFSSGTSGNIKGLNISKKGTECLVGEFINSFKIDENDLQVIFLPLSNFQQRMCVYAGLWSGASIAMVPSINLFTDIKLIKPSFLVAPPAIYEKIHKLGLDNTHNQWLKNTRFLIVGMAPVSEQLLHAYQEKNIRIYEVYGTTETGMIAWNTPESNQSGSMGKPIKNVKVKISPENEIIIYKKYPLSKNYFWLKSNEKDSVFFEDGTINTGDIGYINSEGYLVFQGRKKDIIICPNGIKYSPAEVEGLIKSSSLIDDVAVYFDRVTNSLNAIIVTSNSNEKTNSFVDAWVKKCNKMLKPYQRIKKYIITETHFSIENGMLTRNMKINRSGVYSYFKELFEDNSAGLINE